MSVHARLFNLAHARHDVLLALRADLSDVLEEYGELPAEADQLLRAIWPFLQAYGRRDHHGSVDEESVPMPRPWKPSAAQLAAHAAGLPVPPDEPGDPDE